MDYLNLVTSFASGKTIRVDVSLVSSHKSIKLPRMEHSVVLDTGADRSALSKDFLMRHGYGKYTSSGQMKATAGGIVEFCSCDINGLTIANQFSFTKMKVDVLENWSSHAVVGVIGMDILSQMTFILSHEHKKFLLTNQKVPKLAEIFI